MTGGSLADRIKQRGRLSLAETAGIIRKLASALDDAHRRGVVHRDLKPANILFDGRGEPYVSDFGIAKLGEAAGHLTGTGAAIGTPAYMSPEQVRGEKELDGRSDVYSLGVVIFEMLTGQTPYSADTPGKLMLKHVLEPAPLISAADPTLPAGCDSIILRAMAKTPQARYQSAGELANELREASVEKKPTRRKQPTRIPTAPRVIEPPPALARKATATDETLGETVFPPPAQRKSLSRSGWMGIAMAGLLIAAIAGGGWALSAFGHRLTATPLLVARIQTDTVTPSPTPTPPAPTDTGTTTNTATNTPALPTSTPLPTAISTPTATNTLQPSPTQIRVVSLPTSAPPTSAPTATNAASMSSSPYINMIRAEFTHVVSTGQDYQSMGFEWAILPKTEWPLCPSKSYENWFNSSGIVDVTVYNSDGKIVRATTNQVSKSNKITFGYWIASYSIESVSGPTYYLVIRHFGGCNLETIFINEWVPFSWP